VYPETEKVLYPGGEKKKEKAEDARPRCVFWRWKLGGNFGNLGVGGTK